MRCAAFGSGGMVTTYMFKSLVDLVASFLHSCIDEEK